MTEALLDVQDLRVSFRTERGLVRAVDGVSFSVLPGEVLGVVGESGCGKSVTMMAVMRLIRDPNAVIEGRVVYKGRDLMTLSSDEMRSVRRAEIAMIFQDPMTSLNPVYTVGWQIAEQVRAHEKVSGASAKARAIELLGSVGIPRPAGRVDDFPHQFSGGMRQRVMIAMALSCNPDLLIADEPTTALDVTIQAQILELIVELQRETGTALILITHDLGIVAETAQRVVVMYAGRKVEEAGVEELFAMPLHPYTQGLMASIPRLPSMRGESSTPGGRLTEIPGMVPALTNLPEGCLFAPRCALADSRCRSKYPPYEEKRPGHSAACWHSDKLMGAADG